MLATTARFFWAHACDNPVLWLGFGRAAAQGTDHIALVAFFVHCIVEVPSGSGRGKEERERKRSAKCVHVHVR